MERLTDGFDLYFPFVVHPRDAERKDAVRFDEPFDQFGFLELRMLVIHLFY